MSSFLHYRKRWVDAESVDVPLSSEDLSPDQLFKSVPYLPSCTFENDSFRQVVRACLAHVARDSDSFRNESKLPNSSQLVLELSKRFQKRWEDVPFKKRVISRHLPYTDYSISVTIPVNTQNIKMLYLNVFGEGLRFIHAVVPTNNFRTKQDLLNVLLQKNTDLIEVLISDEKESSESKDPNKLTWFGNILTVNIIQNRLGDLQSLLNESALPFKCEVTQEDIGNSLDRFSLNEVWEVHRLDLFQGDLYFNNIYPFTEV